MSESELYEYTDRHMKIAASEAYEHGKRDGTRVERRHHHRYAWLKLFCLIVLGAFCGHLLFNLIGMFV